MRLLVVIFAMSNLILPRKSGPLYGVSIRDIQRVAASRGAPVLNYHPAALFAGRRGMAPAASMWRPRWADDGLPVNVSWIGGHEYSGSPVTRPNPVLFSDTTNVDDRTETEAALSAYATGGGGKRILVTSDFNITGTDIRLPARTDWDGDPNNLIVIEGNVDVAFGDRAPTSGLRRIQVTGGNEGVFCTASASPAASGYLIRKLELSVSHTGEGAYRGLGAGFGISEAAQNALNKVPEHLHLDRCYVHGFFTGTAATSSRAVRAVGLNCKSGSVTNCTIEWMGGAALESQCISMINGPGPYLIDYNYFGGATEIILTGGGDPALVGNNPSDILISRNHFLNPLTIKDVWLEKQLLELKKGVRVLVVGNWFEGSWGGGQNGDAWGLLNTNQSGGDLGSLLEDVHFVYNRVTKVGGLGYVTGRQAGSGDPPDEAAKRIQWAHNLVDRVNADTDYDGSGWTMIMGGDAEDVAFEYNTVRTPSGITTSWQFGSDIINPIRRHNVAEHGIYGYKGDGTNSGVPTLNEFAINPTIENDIFRGDISIHTYPAGVVGVEDENELWTDPANGDFTVKASSPHKGTGEFGLDPGCDIAGLLEALDGVTD